MENEELIQQVTEKAKKWLTPAYDAETQAEVKRMLENEDKTDLIEAFYKDLEFGTGGLRGIMGVGSNRMNIYTVGAATQGLSNYLNKNFKDLEQIAVVVGHDCRNNSRLFAEISANIFSANGIKVYLFEDMRPTPEMSFAIRHLGCQSGIILTASHNPKEYNGYKAYCDDGAQVLAPHDKGIIDEVNKIASAADIKFEGNKELIQVIGEDIDSIYLDKVHTISIDSEVIKRQKDLSIVYTPIHGTGMMLIPRALKQWGFENVHCVPEQMVKSGDFPTVISPNPENAEALSMAIDLAKKIDEGDVQEINVLIKADVQGSAEALKASMEKLEVDGNVRINVIRSTVGTITESDILLASASNAIIYGFNIRPSAAIRKKAEEEGVEIRLHNIIYKALEELQAAMKGMLAPVYEEVVIGQADVRQIYKVSKVGTIAGCMVTDGKMKRDCKVRLIREGIVVYTGKLGSLRRFENDVKEVINGYECGMTIENFNDIKVGDIIEGFEDQEVEE